MLHVTVSFVRNICAFPPTNFSIGILMASEWNNTCRAPFDGIVVHFSGAVFPCDQLSQDILQESMLIGNIHHNSISEIFEGEQIQYIRQQLLSQKTEGLLCHTCDKAHTCNLYGDPTAGKEEGLLHGGAQEVLYEKPTINRLELAITDLCNMKCTMCSLSRGEASPHFTSKNGFMEFSTIQKIIDDVVRNSEERDILLTLHWIGEPLIHPNIKEILFYIAKNPVLKLHLVTNAISLTPDITTILLKMKGTLNVSLNARKSETFRVVNQSSQFEKVHKNLLYFLEHRKILQKQSDWSVIVSSVVLEDNYLEMPEFVQFWNHVFVGLGEEPSISLNGKGEQRDTQIMLLQEIEQPKSDVYFRETLRLCNQKHPVWDLDEYRVFDDILLGKILFYPTVLFHLPDTIRSRQMVQLIKHVGFYEEMLPFLQLEDPETRQELQNYLTQNNTQFSVHLTKQLELYWNPLLLSIATPQYQSIYLKTLNIEHLTTEPNSLLLWGEILRKNRDVQNHITISFNDIVACKKFSMEERELWCLLFGISYKISFVSKHRKEWLCGILSEIDSPNLRFSIEFEIQSIWDVYLSLFDGSKQFDVPDFERWISSTPKTQQWIIRAIRRKILFSPVFIKCFDWKEHKTSISLEHQLLQLLWSGDVWEFESIIVLALQRERHNQNLWFDLLDIKRYLGFQISPNIIQKLLLSIDCPLLFTKKSIQMAIYVLVEIDIPTIHSFLQDTSVNTLEQWQRKMGYTYIRQQLTKISI